MAAKRSDYQRQYRKRPDARLQRIKTEARRWGRGFWQLTDKVALQLLALPCSYCGNQPSYNLDRRNTSLGYVPANVIPICSICSRAKGRRSTAEFLAWVARIVSRAT